MRSEKELGPRSFPVGLSASSRSLSNTKTIIANKGPHQAEHDSPITMFLSSPPSQTLTTFQPTSSTISFTVSTRPVPKTLPAIVGFYISILVRLLIGALTFATLWTKWRSRSEESTAALEWAFGHVFEAWFIKTLETIQWRYLAPIAMLITFMVFRRGYTGNSPLSFPPQRPSKLTILQKSR